MTTKIADKPARSHCKWAPEELEYFSDHYGLVSDKALACNLGRSVYGVQQAARKLGQRRKDNFYTASELGRVLGIAPETIARWPRRGWLKGRRAPMRQGLHWVWLFTQGNIIRCLRQRPWLVHLESMSEHYFRSVVRREWERDPWYTCQQAAPLLGVKADCTVEDYIHRGWLPADKKPWGCHGAWIIRLSAIQAFLANDPRPLSSHYTISESRRRFLLEAGQASMLAVTWVIECPRCGQQVRIIAPPRLRGGAVREKFIELHVNGNCKHSSYCLIPRRTPKLAPLSRATRARRLDEIKRLGEGSRRGD